MKTVLFMVVVALLASTGAYATTIDLGIFAVSPQGNFLYNSPNDNCSAAYAVGGCNMAPTFINLSAYVGDTITITDVGALCVYTGTSCTAFPASKSYLGAVFSNSQTLADASNIIRVVDGVPSGLGPGSNISTPNLNSLIGNVDTTILNDFFVPQTNILVVAPYLIVGTLDSAFADNSLGTPSSPGYAGFFGVDITVNTSTTPEPGTAALLVTAFAGLWAFRRKFAKQA